MFSKGPVINLMRGQCADNSLCSAGVVFNSISFIIKYTLVLYAIKCVPVCVTHGEELHIVADEVLHHAALLLPMALRLEQAWGEDAR